MNFYVVDADDSFLQEAALNPRVEILDITGITISSGSDSLSNSSEETYPAAMPNWKPFAKLLQELQQQLPELSEPFAEKVNIIFNPKYRLVGNSVDIRTTRQDYLIDRGINSVDIRTTRQDYLIDRGINSVDIRTTRQDYLIDRGIIDRHFFNLIVVSNKIKILDELIGFKATKTCFRYTHNNFSPSEMDEFALREEVKILVSRELVKYFKELAWMKTFVISHISHEYISETKKKSEVISL